MGEKILHFIQEKKNSYLSNILTPSINLAFSVEIVFCQDVVLKFSTVKPKIKIKL